MFDRRSAIDSDRAIKEVALDQFHFLIEEYVRKKPFITDISKRQFWYGNGKFKPCADKAVKAGLLRNCGIKIPKQTVIDKAQMFYGYPALIGPWRDLNNGSNRIHRAILCQELGDGQYSDIRIVLGKGYINEDGTLSKEQTKGISVYFLMLADPEVRPIQQEWLLKQPMWKRHQFLRNQMTHTELLLSQKKSAQLVTKRNNALLKLDEYKQLDSGVDKSKLAWGDEEDFIK